MRCAALISPVLLAACAGQPEEVSRFAPEYRGVTASLLDGELLRIDAKMAGARDGKDVDAYARCAAAQFALDRGFGFARHLRTNVTEEGGVWAADAVYTISPSIPGGLAAIDAETELASCTENGIPTV